MISLGIPSYLNFFPIIKICNGIINEKQLFYHRLKSFFATAENFNHQVSGSILPSRDPGDTGSRNLEQEHKVSQRWSLISTSLEIIILEGFQSVLRMLGISWISIFVFLLTSFPLWDALAYHLLHWSLSQTELPFLMFDSYPTICFALHSLGMICLVSLIGHPISLVETLNHYWFSNRLMSDHCQECACFIFISVWKF